MLAQSLAPDIYSQQQRINEFTFLSFLKISTSLFWFLRAGMFMQIVLSHNFAYCSLMPCSHATLACSSFAPPTGCEILRCSIRCFSSSSILITSSFSIFGRREWYGFGGRAGGSIVSWGMTPDGAEWLRHGWDLRVSRTSGSDRLYLTGR